MSTVKKNTENLQIAEKMSNQKRVKHMGKNILQIFMGPCNVFIYTVYYIYIYITNGFEYLNTIQEMHRKKDFFQFAKILVTLIRRNGQPHTFNLIPARWHMPAAPTRVGHRCPLQAHQSWEESSTKDWKNHVISKASKGNPPKRKALQNWKSLEHHGISACES